MFGSRSRVVAASIAVAGAVALALTAAGTANAVTVTGGTGTLTVNDSYLLGLAKQGIVVVPTHTQSVSSNATTKTVTVVYAATGGNADLTAFNGRVLYSGDLTFVNVQNGEHATVSSLNFQVFSDTFAGTANDGTTTAVLDAKGSRQATSSGATQTFSASDLEIDSTGASFLDTALGTTAFSGGDQVGSFTTSFTRG
jgi:hypothetical protein